MERIHTRKGNQRIQEYRYPIYTVFQAFLKAAVPIFVEQESVLNALVDSLEELFKQTIHLSGNKVNVEAQIVGTNGFVFGFQSIDEKQNLTKLNFCLESRIKKKKMKQHTWKGRIFLTDQRRTKISYKYFYTCIEPKKNIIDIINCDNFNYVKNVGLQVYRWRRRKKMVTAQGSK